MPCSPAVRRAGIVARPHRRRRLRAAVCRPGAAGARRSTRLASQFGCPVTCIGACTPRRRRYRVVDASGRERSCRREQPAGPRSLRRGPTAAMTPERLRRILEQVARGELDPTRRFEPSSICRSRISASPRSTIIARCAAALPEVVFGTGKTPEQIVAIAARAARRAGRASCHPPRRRPAAALRDGRCRRCTYDAHARLAYWRRPSPPPAAGAGTIVVVAAGTADLPVAEEAALTAELMGQQRRARVRRRRRRASTACFAHHDAAARGAAC